MAKGSGGGAFGAQHKLRVNTGIEIVGLEELLTTLKDVAPRVANNILRTTVHGVAGEVRDGMREKVTKDERTLEKAIFTKRNRQKGNVISSDVRIRHGKGQKHDAYYWHFIEFGTDKSQAKPFIVPTVEAMRPGLPQTFRRQFGEKFESTMAREAKKALKK